jgi:uncharacterized membrane protein
MNHNRFRIANNILVIIALLVVGLTWAMMIYFYPQLPNAILTHFDVRGAVDSMTAKSWWSVYFPGMLQIILTTLLWWLSRHPEFSHLPTGLVIRLIPEPTQTKVRALVSHSLIMTMVLIDLIMSYLALAVITTGLDIGGRMNGWFILVLTGLLILINVIYAVWVGRLVRTSQTQLH